MSYATAVLADSPLAWWKLGEADAATVADNAEGTAARDGSYGGSPNLGEMVLLAGAPGETSMLLTGDARYMDGPALALFYDMETWAVELVLRPADNTQRGIIHHPSKWQLYRQATGKLGYFAWIAGDWRFAQGVAVLAPDTTYVVGIERTTSHIRIYVNGALDVEVAQAGAVGSHGAPIRVGTTSAAATYFSGHISHVSIYADGLSGARWLAHYNAAITVPNDPPTTPGAYTVPTPGQVIDAGAILAWGASTDPESDAITYEEEIQLDGGAWTALHALQSGATYAFDAVAYDFAAAAVVRVRAFSAGGGGYSDWRESPEFSITHTSETPVAEVTILSRSDKTVVVKVKVTDPDGVHAATQYQVDTSADDFTGAPKIDTGWLTDYRKTLVELTAMPANTAFLLRARARDQGGQVGGWTYASFRTRRIFALGIGDTFEQERNEGTHADAVTLESEYGQLVFGAGFTPAYPDLAPGEFSQSRDGRGYRVGWVPVATDYVQPVAPGTQIYTRYSGANLNPTSAGSSFMLIFQPRFDDPAGKNILFGSEEWWIYRSGTQIVGRGVGYDGAVPLDNFLTVNGLDLDGTNILIGTYLREVMVNNVITTPGKFVLWLNGVFSGIGSLHTPVLPFPTTSIGGDSVSADMRFTLGTAPHNYLWLGTQSSDGARVIGDSNYYGFQGVPREFAWWNDRLMSDEDAIEIYEAYNKTDPDAVAAVVKAMEPILYDRFRQPMQPSKPILEADMI